MNRLLLIGDPNSIYVHNYAIQLRKHYGSALIIDLFATFPTKRKVGTMPYDHLFGRCSSDPTHPAGKLPRWFRPWQLYRFLRNKRRKYDVVHVLYCIQDLMIAARQLRRVAPRLILTMFGSDFYQLPGWKKPLMHKVWQSADFITSNNSLALEAIRKSFSVNPERMKLCRFGFNALDTLHAMNDTLQPVCRERLGIPTEKVVVCIGYNYDSIQQHIPILKSIAANPGLLSRKDELFFLIPMTYGTEPAYRAELLKALSQFHFPYLAPDHFLSEEDNACLRKAPDVMIQLQKSDSLSASSQEHMYARNLLITGKWLPYHDLVEAGIYFRSIQVLEDTGAELLYCIENLVQEKKRCLSNPAAIYKLSSWNSNLPSWLDLYA